MIGIPQAVLNYTRTHLPGMISQVGTEEGLIFNQPANYLLGQRRVMTKIKAGPVVLVYTGNEIPIEEDDLHIINGIPIVIEITHTQRGDASDQGMESAQLKLDQTSEGYKEALKRVYYPDNTDLLNYEGIKWVRFAGAQITNPDSEDNILFWQVLYFNLLFAIMECKK